MKIPYTWLKDYVDIDVEPRVLAEQLTMAGLEVDHVEERWKNIVTAKIVWKEPIKGSDHLNATRVTTGSGPSADSGRELSVVCGAPNISVGDVVPLALPGAEFETDGGTITIGVTKKRGVLSEGMLCSPRELGLSSDHSGIYLLPEDTPLGQPLAETIIDLDIKAHRGDLFSMTGVAREVAAFSGKQLRLPPLNVPEQGKQTVHDLARVTVEDTEMCPRFTARVIRNIKIGPSPLWMVQRLAAAGMRSINNVVDIANYVMWEIGQPLHTFDYDRVAEHHLIVRRAKKGETLRTLDDQERELTPEMMLVCDPTGPISVAGVMGGATSEISDTTTNVLLEAATWNPVNIRRTSTKLGLRSESSSRYEKGLDPELASMGLDRAAQLLAELAGGEVAPGYIDNYPQPVEPRTLRFNARDVEWLMGYQASPSEVANALTSLQFGVVLDEDGENMTVTVPTWRGDVKESADLVEEVARMLGYDRITGTIPSGPLPEPQQVDWFERENLVRDIVSGAGCREVVTYPLTNRAAMLQILSDQSNVASLLTGAVIPAAKDAPVAANGKKKGKSTAPTITNGTTTLMIPPEQMPAITLANALSAKQDTLRLTLLVSLMETVAYNAHQGVKSVRIFELGRRYIPSGADASALPHERRSLGIMLAGLAGENWLEGAREHDFFDLKAVAERLFADMHIVGVRYTPTQHPTFHPGRCALIELVTEGDGVPRPAGVIGEVHPEVTKRYDLNQRVYALELDLERLFQARAERVRYQPISRHPALTRDLAVVVDKNVPASEIEAVIREAGGDLVRSVTLFDVYEGEPIPAGKRNLAFTIVYQSQDRTLNDADGDAERAKVAKLLRERFDATIRE